MKVFVTGGSGFIGSAVISELLRAGHEVIALARSEKSALKIESLGKDISVLRGDLENLTILKKGASEAEGVIHLGFIHDFENFKKCCEIDRRATIAILDSLVNSKKSFVYTNGVFTLPAGELSNENTPCDPNAQNFRGMTEEMALAYKDKGVAVSCVRLAPTVHGKGDKGFIPMIMNVARSSKLSGYIGAGQNVWPAVHRLDAAHLYRLTLEKGRAGSVYHGVAEEGVKSKEIAEAIGIVLNVPVISIPVERAAEKFGFLGHFFARDSPVSSERTRKELNWKPHNIGLLEDLVENYSF